MAKNGITQEAPAPELWERQPGESSQAFQAFAEYRDMGIGRKPRSAAKVGEKLGKSTTLMERWCSRWHWKARAEAFDDENDRLEVRKLQDGIVEMRKRHTDIAKVMLVKALRALDKIPPEEMSAKDTTTMIETASKLERISRGEATERTEGKQTIAGEISLSAIDLSKVSDEELAALDAITGKIFSE